MISSNEVAEDVMSFSVSVLESGINFRRIISIRPYIYIMGYWIYVIFLHGTLTKSSLHWGVSNNVHSFGLEILQELPLFYCLLVFVSS